MGKWSRTAVPLFSLALAGCCGSFEGYGRYSMNVDCETVAIEGQTYQLTRSGNDLMIGGRVLQRGINRDARPWIYVHHVQGDQADITFDKGDKDIYPLHTGATASIFSVYAHPWEVSRSTNAAFANDYWLVLHRWAPDGLRMDLQRRTGDVTDWQLVQADIAVAGDGSPTDVPDINTRVEVLAFDAPQQTASVRFTPIQSRIPVLFVHGHSGDAVEAWQVPGSAQGSTSVAAALAANPGLRIDPFYLDLPVHGAAHPENHDRSIEDDALDILAEIEGGADSQGNQRTGLLNMPQYQGIDRVAIVAYSQGTLSSRYYVKTLMGSRHGSAITVSELVTLASPNHGVGGSVSCGDANEPDRTLRQMCAGRSASLLSMGAPCGNCAIAAPAAFATNSGTDATFLTDLNGHDLDASCQQGFTHPGEAPSSRPSTPDGILYVNLFASGNGDLLVGGDTQGGDCLGRRLARNHAPDAVNRGISGIGGTVNVHGDFPHHWPVICMALRTVTDHAAPANQAAACQGLTPP